jgi:hypothetical protein
MASEIRPCTASSCKCGLAPFFLAWSEFLHTLDIDGNFDSPTVRVFWPLIKIRVHFFLVHLGMLATLRSRREMNDRAFKSFLNMLPIGQNPFEFEVKYRSWVGVFDLPAASQRRAEITI